jgi:hypothetical protein
MDARIPASPARVRRAAATRALAVAFAVLAVCVSPARAIPPPADPNPWAEVEKTQIDSLASFPGVWKRVEAAPAGRAAGGDQGPVTSVEIRRPGNSFTIAFLEGDTVEEVFLLTFAGPLQKFEIYKDGHLACALRGGPKDGPCPAFEGFALVGYPQVGGHNRIEWWDDQALGRHVHTVMQVEGDKLTVSVELEPGNTEETVTFVRQAEQ